MMNINIQLTLHVLYLGSAITLKQTKDEISEWGEFRSFGGRKEDEQQKFCDVKVKRHEEWNYIVKGNKTSSQTNTK
jgi:hypothetical protein